MSVLHDIYETYRAKLLECGATPEEANATVEEARKLDQSLNNRICPECQAAVVRALDEVQTGPIGILIAQTMATHSAWFKYTCNSCNFFMSRIESVEKAS